MKSIRPKHVTWRLSTAVAIMLLAAAWAISGGCSRSETGSLYGQAMSGHSLTKVSDILARPGEYDGRVIALRGKIVQECPSGCWFNLEDETGVIYVNLESSGFEIPQYTGKEVTVEGTVMVQGQRVMVVGKGVKVG